MNLFRRIISCTNGLQVDAAVSVAYLLSETGINTGNYQLFFALVQTNNPYVVDALVGERDPALLFVGIRPHRLLIHKAFEGLAAAKPKEIYDKALMVYLGVIQNAYKTSRYGYTLYPLTISDVYNIGKFLDKRQGQQGGVNRLILDILLDIYQMGIDGEDRAHKDVALTANRIRMAFFDDTKEMLEAIPVVLLYTDRKILGKVQPLRYTVE